MNVKQIVAAVLLAAAVGPALAATAPTSEDTVLRISGSSAVDRTLFEAILDPDSGLCQTGRTTGAATSADTVADYDTAVIPDVYIDSASAWSTSAPAPAYFTIRCKSQPTAATSGTVIVGLDGVDIAIMKSSGASETGIVQVSTQTAAATINGSTSTIQYNSFTCSNAGGTGFAAPVTTGNKRLGYRYFTGCAKANGTDATAPQAGIADVEASLFNVADTGLTQQGALTTPFTMFVSRNFYQALQTAQSIDTTTGTCSGEDGSSGVSKEACMPSLTTAQVRALLSRGVTKPSELGITYGADAAIVLCRRGNTSGTQKSMEVMFFGQGCGRALAPVKFGADVTVAAATQSNGVAWSSLAASPSAVGKIFYGSGTGEVEKCLDAAAATTTTFAVGIASADRTPSSGTGTKRYNYIKIDGYAPTVENVMAQKWQYTTENSLYSNATALAVGNKQVIFDALLTQFRNPTTVARTHGQSAILVDTADTATARRTGFLVRPTAAANWDRTYTSTTPIAPTIRAASQNSPALNNCSAAQPLKLIKP